MNLSYSSDTKYDILDTIYKVRRIISNYHGDIKTGTRKKLKRVNFSPAEINWCAKCETRVKSTREEVLQNTVKNLTLVCGLSQALNLIKIWIKGGDGILLITKRLCSLMLVRNKKIAIFIGTICGQKECFFSQKDYNLVS